ncbi:acyltransferase 3 [Coriobacterium glomerans PW2]|uniref:Acyltransferase 3 n=1 Tax=Coriobacterium glomerans (strain ATCC 49209 / DSM 20642 / JCM 10262 / PW2) TaxID=700015 RepID=F2NAQ3_CORGP|nr:acyltransferase [Coriobacterium glomerans]AEB07509.1 acyltransferase 3 [Coriobacterium glomerans PW2]
MPFSPPYGIVAGIQEMELAATSWGTMDENRSNRIASLDGLRGIACLSVLLLHIGMMIRPLGADSPYGLIPGTASVLIFFVLSGVVLSIAPLARLRAGAHDDWLGYYPRRVVRLGIPAAAAIALGIIAGFVAWRMGQMSRSAMAVEFSSGARRAVHDILMQFDLLFNVSDDTVNLFGGAISRVDSPVWSMSWELWFSLTLPLAIACIGRIRRDGPAVLGALAAIFLSSWSGYFPLRLCLMFWIGTLLARRWERLRALRLPRALEVISLIAAALLIELPQLVATGPLGAAALSTAMSAACAACVALAMTDGLLHRALSCKPILMLGALSYSLYLTHAITIGAIEALLPRIGIASPLMLSGIALAASLGVATAFWRLIERPSIRLSHVVGRATHPSRGGVDVI